MTGFRQILMIESIYMFANRLPTCGLCALHHKLNGTRELIPKVSLPQQLKFFRQFFFFLNCSSFFSVLLFLSAFFTKKLKLSICIGPAVEAPIYIFGFFNL